MRNENKTKNCRKSIEGIYHEAFMSCCGPLAFDAAFPDQWIVFDQFLFGLITGNVFHSQRAHLKEKE
jgi:hypothetical protein